MADLGASWLGWDVVRGCEATQLNIAGLCDITMTPRKYGFHGTLKPPFRLRSDRTIAELKQFTLNLAERVEPAVCKGLYLTTMGRFLALAPQGETSALQRLRRHVCVILTCSGHPPMPLNWRVAAKPA